MPVTESATRTSIVLAAMDLFARNGYERTSIGEIAQASGARAGSIYHFFPTKAEIVCAVLEMYLEGLYPVVMDPAFARSDDPLERVFAVLDDYREKLVKSDFAYRCPIGSLALEVSNELPQARALINKNFAAWRTAIEACFIAARRRLKKGTDPHALAAFVLTVMEGGLMQCAAEQSIAPFDASVLGLRTYLTSLTIKGTS